jgi:hypothetical protein
MCAGQVVFILPLFAVKENRRCEQDRSYLYFLFLLPKRIKDVCGAGRICSPSFCGQRESKMCTGQVVFVLPIFTAKENRRCVQDRSYLFFLFLLPKRIKDVCRKGRFCSSYFCCQRESKVVYRTGRISSSYFCFQRESKMSAQDRSYLFFIFCGMYGWVNIGYLLTIAYNLTHTQLQSQPQSPPYR